MNYCGSYRNLIGNSKSALLSAIEIYNKPNFKYRDETFVILLLNAWELLLKAILSRHHKSIYYPKRRKEPYRTLSMQDAFNRAEPLFTSKVVPLPLRRNLDLLSTYRDNAVHFYNEPGFGSVVYSLAQTSVINFKDLLCEVFGVHLEREITWQLLPLGLEPPIDPIAYLSGKRGATSGRGLAARQFLTALTEAVKEVDAAGADTGRLLTVFKVNLESVKKIGKADVVVGVNGAPVATGPLVITKTRDPNISHPLRQKVVAAKVGSLHGKKISSYVFQAISRRYDFRNKPELCWRAAEGVLTKYSEDVVAFIKRLSKEELESAISEYKKYLKQKMRAGRKV